MELKVLMMAFDRLSDEHEKLKTEMNELREEMRKLKNAPTQVTTIAEPAAKEDELLDLKQVQAMLGICYNSLKKLISRGLIKPIRINERRVRFSRLSILNYIRTESTKS